MKKIVSVLAVLAMIICMDGRGYCQSPFRKLGRGVANIATSPFEVPKGMTQDYFESASFFESFLIGFPKGLFNMFARLAAGAYETVTFPIPVPEGYQPIMEPEFSWEQ